MRIQSIDFVQHQGKPLEWRLDGFTLRPINLIVGKNASGKSKALSSLRDLAWMLSGRSKPDNAAGSYVARFLEGEIEHVYTLGIEDAKVLREELIIGGETKLTRGNDGAGKIYFNQRKEFIEFQSPRSELAAVARRDVIQHPYLDELYTWGRGAFYYRFNSFELGKHFVAEIPDPSTEENTFDATKIRTIQPIYVIGTEAFGEDFKRSICQDMGKLGYPIEDIGVRHLDDFPGDVPSFPKKPISLYVIESGLKGAIDQFSMSDGMFRTLSVLIQMTYATMSGKPSCVLIDDIGEGLDHERSCLLIKLLIEKAESSQIQLVMTTNDRFVMNNVPLEHWSILVRRSAEKGTRVEVYNYENHRDIFDQFEYTGLNNFDFFSTRFFEEGLKEDE